MIEESISKIDAFLKKDANELIAISLLKIIPKKTDYSDRVIDCLVSKYGYPKTLCYVMVFSKAYSIRDVAEKMPFFDFTDIEKQLEEMNAYVIGIFKKVFDEEKQESLTHNNYYSQPINSNSFYNGPRFSSIIINTYDGKEDVSPDWGYLDDIKNNDGF